MQYEQRDTKSVSELYIDGFYPSAYCAENKIIFF